MAPKNKGKVGNSAPTKKKQGTRSTVSTSAPAKAKNKNNRKRQASDSDSDGSSDDSSESSDTPAQPKRKPRKRKKSIEEYVDIPNTVPEEEIDDEAVQSSGGNGTDNVSCY